MLPQDTLSTEPVPAAFQPPRNRIKRPWHDDELGGVAIGDASQGLEVKVWHLEHSDGDFLLSAPGATTTVLHSTTDPVREVALAFDQNMQPLIAWLTEDGDAWYRWLDSLLPGFDVVALPAGSTSPRMALDDHRDIATNGGWSDVILAYLLDGDLRYRQLRDRFDTEYTLREGLEGAALSRIGLNDLLRFQFAVLRGPGTAGSDGTPQALTNGGFEADGATTAPITGWTIASEDVNLYVLETVEGFSISGSGLTLNSPGFAAWEGDYSAVCLLETSAWISFASNDRLPTTPGQIQQCRLALTPLYYFGSGIVIQPHVRWYDDGEVFLSETSLPWRWLTDTEFNISAVPQSWLVHVFTATAPAGAAYWAPRIQVGMADEEVAVIVLDGIQASTIDPGSVDDAIGTTVARVVERACARAGVIDVDTGDLDNDAIWGYTVSRETSGRTILEQMRTIGRFDIVERGPTLRFPKRGGDIVATIPAAALGAHVSGESPPAPITVTRGQDIGRPRQMRLRYNAIDRDYQSGETLSPARQETRSTNDVSAETPVAMSQQRAAETVAVLHSEAWASASTYQFSLDAGYAHLEPADPILVPFKGRGYRMRIVKIRNQGSAIHHIEALRDDEGAYVSVAIDDGTGLPIQTVSVLAQTALGFLDLPSLVIGTHDEAGFYLRAGRAGAGTNWPGATVYDSDDGVTFTQRVLLAEEAVTGTVVTPPAAGADGYTWDNERELVIDVDRGTLATATDAAVLAGANRLAIGPPAADPVSPPAGPWQIVQWANAELVSPGRYRLTRLLHGRRGTEHLIDTMSAGDVVVVLSGIARIALDDADIDVTRFYRGVTNGAAYETGVVASFASAARALLPFAGVDAEGVRDTTGDLDITWIRRDRLSNTLVPGATVPMSEDSEAYEVDIMDGTAVVRTLSGLSTPAAVYTAAQQTTDFGSAQASVDVRIYQVSAEVGRGLPLIATV